VKQSETYIYSLENLPKMYHSDDKIALMRLMTNLDLSEGDLGAWVAAAAKPQASPVRVGPHDVDNIYWLVRDSYLKFAQDTQINVTNYMASCKRLMRAFEQDQYQEFLYACEDFLAAIGEETT
jgi:hypothetical protein